MFYTHFKTNFNFLVTFILSSASGFNLDRAKVFLFGKVLPLRYIVLTLTILRRHLKTVWENKQMQVISIFSFSPLFGACFSLPFAKALNLDMSKIFLFHRGLIFDILVQFILHCIINNKQHRC